jgi:hypothetical protein
MNISLSDFSIMCSLTQGKMDINVHKTLQTKIWLFPTISSVSSISVNPPHFALVSSVIMSRLTLENGHHSHSDLVASPSCLVCLCQLCLLAVDCCGHLSRGLETRQTQTEGYILVMGNFIRKGLTGDNKAVFEVARMSCCILLPRERVSGN